MTFEQHVKTMCIEKNLPAQICSGFLEFCSHYSQACQDGKNDPITFLPHFATFLSCVQKELKEPSLFSAYHKAVSTPTDYYRLGLEFIRPLIDFAHSMVLGKKSLAAIELALENKENVILLANHQTEVDPQIISLLIEKEFPLLAKEMIFVAGHRVTTDPLAVPLSLGRNLICIHSKRHIDTPPEKKSEKLTHNQKAMRALEELLHEGGKCIYIAPSGGRDRVDTAGVLQVARFDPQSVELFYLLSQKSRHPTHFYTLALETYPILPPPDEVRKEIGEQRITRYSPAHLLFGERIDMQHVGNCHLLSDKKERRVVRTEAIWQQVVSDYQIIASKKP